MHSNLYIALVIKNSGLLIQNSIASYLTRLYEEVGSSCDVTGFPLPEGNLESLTCASQLARPEEDANMDDVSLGSADSTASLSQRLGGSGSEVGL